MTIEQVFKRVRIKVRDKTAGLQIPWESSSLTYEVYLNQEFILKGGVLNNKAWKKPSPVYPEAAIAMGITGQISVLVIYDETGHVISATAYGNKFLKEAAEEAAYQAVFPPTSINGKRVKVTGYLTYDFDLQEKKNAPY